MSLFPTLEVPLVSKEDALVSKLLWVMEGSGKSRQDIIGMLLDPTPFDPELVEGLCHELGCFDLWQEMRNAAESGRPARG